MDEFDYNNEYSYVYELSKLIREILKSKHKKIILENHLNKIIIVLEKAIKTILKIKIITYIEYFVKNLVNTENSI